MPYKTVSFGTSKSGIATVGYQLYNTDGTANGGRITAGVQDLGGGSYGAVVSMPTNFRGRISWSTAVGSNVVAHEEINPTLDDVVIEAATSGVTTDSGATLTSLNMRQAVALMLSSLAGNLSGAATTEINIKPAGKPSAASRITAEVNTVGDRLDVAARVPD